MSGDGKRFFRANGCRAELVGKMSQEDNSLNVTLFVPKAHGSWRSLSYFREIQVNFYSFQQFTQGLNYVTKK